MLSNLIWKRKKLSDSCYV